MKQLVSIVLTLLLLALPFTPVAVSASPGPACAKCCMPAGVDTNCGMPSCCLAKPIQGSQPAAPSIPSQNNAGQNQVSFVTLAALIWTLPETPAGQTVSSFVSPSRATGAPLYERNCILLI